MSSKSNKNNILKRQSEINPEDDLETVNSPESLKLFVVSSSQHDNDDFRENNLIS